MNLRKDHGDFYSGVRFEILIFISDKKNITIKII